MGGAAAEVVRRPRPRSCSSRRTSSRRASPRPRSGSASAPRRARASNAASTRTAPAPARCARWSCSPRSPRRNAAPRRDRRVPAADRAGRASPCAPAASTSCSAPQLADDEIRGTARAARHRRSRATASFARSRRRGGPTSSARSTSSRRSPAASGSTASARTVPSNPEKIGGLTPAQRERRAVADVLVGAGFDEVYTLPLVAPADLARAGIAADGVIEVENPLRAEESILRPALLAGRAARGRVQRRARQSRRRAVRDRDGVRAARRRATRCRDERLHLAWRAPGRVVRSAARARP